MSNDDQVEGKAKDIGGKLKEETGEITGNKDLKREGQSEQVEGKVQKGFGNLKDKLSGDK